MRIFKPLFFSLLLALSLCGGETFDWSKVPETYPGIRLAEEKKESPRLLQLRAARIDLTTPGLAFCTTGRGENWGKPMPDFPSLPIHTRRQTTRDFMKEHPQVVLAVNASPWGPWQPPWCHRYAARLGLVISDGVLVSPPRGTPSLLIDDKGGFSFRIVDKKESLKGIVLAVSGFYFVLKDGKSIQVGKGKSLAPRTGYGLSRDHRYLYFLTVDGRQPGYSLGCSTGEVGDFLRYYGAWEGVNMDGGGSTTMVLREKNQTLRRLNHAKGERAVANNLGIFYRSQKTK